MSPGRRGAHRSIPHKVSRRLTILVTLSLAVFFNSVAWASEGGSFGNYGVGAQTLGSGLLGPPATFVQYGYLLSYSADRFADDRGHSAIPGFDLNIIAVASMTRYTWDITCGGFTFASALILEALHVDVEAGGVQDEATGLAFVNVQPLAVARSFGNWHLMTATHVFFPTGNYDRNALANSTLNHKGITQELSVTWTPTARWMIDLSSSISFNRRNPDTAYRSGTLMGLTWAANYRPFESNQKWQIGINGLYLDQIRDDEIDGQAVPGGFQLRKVTAGPQFGYWITPAAAIVVKWAREYEVRNAPQGDQIWLQAAFPF